MHDSMCFINTNKCIVHCLLVQLIFPFCNKCFSFQFFILSFVLINLFSCYNIITFFQMSLRFSLILLSLCLAVVLCDKPKHEPKANTRIFGHNLHAAVNGAINGLVYGHPNPYGHGGHHGFGHHGHHGHGFGGHHGFGAYRPVGLGHGYGHGGYGPVGPYGRPVVHGPGYGFPHHGGFRPGLGGLYGPQPYGSPFIY